MSAADLQCPPKEPAPDHQPAHHTLTSIQYTQPTGQIAAVLVEIQKDPPPPRTWNTSAAVLILARHNRSALDQAPPTARTHWV